MWWLAVSLAFGNPIEDQGLDTPSSVEPPRPVPILGGEDVESGRWPEVAGIYFNDGWGEYVACTGVLIAPDVVLTAGHCAEGITSVNLDTVDHTVKGEYIRVDEIHEYPNSWSSYDITALVLEEPSTVAPARIAEACIIDDYLRDGADVAIVGYGGTNTSSTRYVNELQEGYTTVTDADCSNVDWGCNASVRPDGEVGAGGDGVDTCPGDSGGPMYLLTEYGEFLVGITSRAWWWADRPCGDGGVYVRPDAVLDWVEEVTDRDIPRVTCNNEPPIPLVDTLYVERDGSGTVQIHPNDPDDSDIRYQIVAQPEHGAAQVAADGWITFNAESGYVGRDRLTVAVVDRGVPGYTIETEVHVKVLRPGAYRRATTGGCGCDAGGVGGSVAGVLAVAALARRRRTT